jgi:hypothetical protein
MTIKGIKELGGNDLSELASLLREIEDLVERKYKHVADFLPPSYMKETDKLLYQVLNEREARGY